MIQITCLSDVKEAIDLYTKGLKKSTEHVTNRALGQILYVAAGRTRRMQDVWPVRKIDEPIIVTLRGKVRKKSRNAAYMRKLWKTMSAKPAAVRAGVRSKKLKVTLAREGTVESSTRLFYALVRKENPKAKGSVLTKAAHRKWSKRHYASGYTALSWTPAVAAISPQLASRMKGGKSGKWNPNTLTAKGKKPPAGAILATARKLQAIGTNAAPVISSIGKDAVFSAIPSVRNDMKAYAEEQIKKLNYRAWKSRVKKLVT